MNEIPGIQALQRFLRLEAAAGILLIAAAALALFAANSPLRDAYDALFELRIAVLVGELLALDKPLLLWVNDGLMALFFLLVGLEIKREVQDGELSNVEQLMLPVFGALGGFLVPAAIYYFINRDSATALAGWAIPAATDIAFALGVLALLGDRVPASLKAFLASLAIIDDLAAIIVIAVFYTRNLSVSSLLLAGACVVVLIALNRLRVRSVAAYLLVGVIMWVCVLKSGVHATLAGVVVALTIPRALPGTEYSPARDLEHRLHPWAAYLILPLFAFANAGVFFGGPGFEQLRTPVSIGIALGLFVGKQLGAFGAVAALIGSGYAKLPSGSNWAALYGVCILTGIGFTMSLFIGTLAFEQGRAGFAAATRLGVLAGSVLSAVAGYLVLRAALRRAPT